MRQILTFFGLGRFTRPLAFHLALAALVFAAGCEPRNREADPVAAALRGAGEQIQYRRLVLPNQLKVMLVSDPGVERSGAALSVAVGSLDDPAGRPGVAHFLEHMLFLGTKKYPEAGSYQKYLNSHAGFSNAYTADDHTNYFFEMTHEGFEEGLDRFAWFFIGPSFDQEYAEREVKAVDSEHSKNLENDYWRVRQVQRNTYDPGHPINRFSTGNLQTLAGVGNAELRDFHRRQYSSNRMALAVVGKQPLDELEKLVRERFGQIENRRLAPNRYPEVYLKPKEVLRVLSVEPVADQRSLVAEFPLPPIRGLYASKPLRLIASVLGNEARGSLLSLLKEQNLATGLSAGVGESTADYASFHVRISLTPAGLPRYQEVLAMLLGAVEGLRRNGLPRYLYDENRTMAELGYRFRERRDASSQARGLSARMQMFPLDKLPEAVHYFTRFDPAAIQDLLRRIRPGNMLVTLIAKGVRTDSTEPFYKTRFGYEELSGPPFERLAAARAHPQWQLPAPNSFIPRRVTLRRPGGPAKLGDTSFYHLQAARVAGETLKKLEPLRQRRFAEPRALWEALAEVLPAEEAERVFPKVAESLLPLPIKLMDTPRARVWYQPGWRFRQPKAYLTLKFYTEGASASPRQAMLATFYDAALAEALNEYGYPLREAGLSFSVASHASGVTLSVGGYSANLLGLLREVVTRLREVPIDQKTFDSLKERLRRGLQNARFGQPYRQARYFRRLLLEQPAFTREARLQALRQIDLAAVSRFAAGFYDRVYVEGVVLGNLAPGAARAAIRGALNSLGSKPLPEPERVRREVRLMAVGSDFVFSDRLAINNSLASYYYQVGPTNPRLRGALLIISRSLREKFYFDMRTRQQLGYIVSAGMGQVKKTLSLNFLVQSGAHPADVLLQRMDAFIPGFVKDFAKLSPEQFEKFRNAVIQAKLERSNTLSEAARRLFWIAFENDAQWDHVSEDIRAVQTVTRAEVEEILNHHLLGRGARRLAIRLLGRDHPAGRPKASGIEIPASAKGPPGRPGG